MKMLKLAAAVALLPGLHWCRAADPPPAQPVTPARDRATAAARSSPARSTTRCKSVVQDGKKSIGVSALVYERGKEAYFGAFGLADRENNKPMARDTIVQIFSMTKPVTGVALMKLYERGKFELDEPLANYLPEYANVRVFAGLDANGQPRLEAPKRPITVRDILRHTAGFRRRRRLAGRCLVSRREAARGIPEHHCRVVSQKLAAVPLLYQPGTRWLYSDAVDIQAALTEKISGVPFDKFLELHIFKPLGMTTTRYAILPTDPIVRGSPRCTRATRTARSRARPTRKRTPSTARAGLTSPAASGWSPHSTTT